MIVSMAYFTLVLGEFVPKLLTLQNVENLVLLLTGPFGFLSRLTYFPMGTLSFSANVILKLIGNAATAPTSTSPEEIEFRVKQGAVKTVIRPVKERLLSVFDYLQRHLQDVMTQQTSKSHSMRRCHLWMQYEYQKNWLLLYS